MKENNMFAEEVMVTDSSPEMPGWQVLNPDGTVVTSGPGIVLEMVALTGEEE